MKKYKVIGLIMICFLSSFFNNIIHINNPEIVAKTPPFLINNITNNTIIEEEIGIDEGEEKMKYQQFETVEWSGATHIKDVLYIKQMININDDIVFYTIMDGNDFKTYKYVISTNTETLEDTTSSALLAIVDGPGENVVVVFLDNVLYILCTWIDIVNEDYEIILRSYTVDTDTWANECNITKSSNSANTEEITAVDIFKLDGNIYFFVLYNLRVLMVDKHVLDIYLNDGTSQDTQNYGAGTVKLTCGYPNETDAKYYFINRVAALQYRLMNFDKTTINEEDILDATPDNESNTLNSIYWEKGKGRIWIYNYQMWYYDITEDIWTDYGRAINQKCCVIRDSTGDITHIIWDNKIYLWEDAGGLGLIQQEPSSSYTRDFKKDIEGSDITGVVQWGTSDAPDLSDWTDAGSILSVVSTYSGHNEVLYGNNTTGGTLIPHISFTGQTSGSIEFFMGEWNGTRPYIYIRNEGGSEVIRIALTSATNIRVYYALTYTDTTIVSGSFPHIRVDFDMATDKQSVWVNGILKVNDLAFYNNRTGTTMNDFMLYLTAGASLKIDALGFSWDDYITGSNRHLTETDFICGCNNMFIADQSIYKLYLPTFAITTKVTPVIKTEIYKAPAMRLSSQVQPFDNQYLLLYDDNEVEDFRGFVLTYDLEGREYVYKMRHGAEYDLDNKIVDSYSVMTASDILKQDMDNECAFLKYGRGTNEDVEEFVDGLTGWTIVGADANETATWLDEKILSGVKVENVCDIWDNDVASDIYIHRSDFSGTVISIKLGISDVTKYMSLYITEGGTDISTIRIIASNLEIYNGVAWQNVQAVSNNTCYHITFNINVSSDTVDIYVNGDYKQTENLWNNITTKINKIRIVSGTTQSNYHIYASKVYVHNSLHDAMSSYNSISPLTTNTYTFKSKRKTIEDRQIWADAQEGYVSSIRPNGLTYYDRFSAGVTINNRFSGHPKLKYVPIKASKVIIYGGYLNGTPLKGVAYGEPNFGTYWDEFDELDTQAKVDAMADQILTDKNIKIGRFKCVTYGLGNVYAGTSVTLTCSKYGISNETWYCVQSVYNPVTDKCQVWLTDAYWVPYVDRKEANNTQSIGTNAEEINTNSGDITTNITDITSLEEINAIGSANAQWNSVIFELETSVGKVVYVAGISNVDGTDLLLVYKLPIPKNKGSKKLYINAMRCQIYDADATNYISRARVVGIDSTGLGNVLNDQNPPAPAWNTVGEKTETFTAIDCSSYREILGYLNIVVDTANNLDIAGFQFRCYYD